MAMTSASIAAELQRKRNLGIKPTNSANMGAYNSLTAKPAIGHAQPNPTATTQKQPISIGDTNAYVRKTLTDNGFADGDIGWDPGRKMVTLQGKDFLSPSQSVGGYSVANRDAIAGALGQFRDNQSTNKTNDLMGKYETAVNTPYKAPEFNYDPNSDPVYQAAIRRAQANAGTASGNAEAEMNRRGILNSTITGDRVAQIQQSEMGRVSDTVLPQLFQQAYGRYRDSVGDQYQQRRDNIGDTQNLLGTQNGLAQQGRDNAYRDKTYNRGVMESDRTYAYQQARDKIADEHYKTEFDYNVKKDGLVMALQKAQLAHQISNDAAQNAIAGMNAATSRMNAGTSASSLAWSKSDKNPDNIYKNKQIADMGKPDMNKAFDDLSNTFVYKNTDTGMPTVTNPPALRAAILGMGLSDGDTDQMLLKFGLQPN